MSSCALRALPLLVPVLAGACSDGGDGDAAPPPDARHGCLSLEDATPAGTAELGTGNDSFEAMPDQLPFQTANQGGTVLVLHARTADLLPGNLDGPLSDPANPSTKFVATLFDGTRVGDRCTRQPYEPSAAEGTYELEQSYQLEFLPCELGEQAFNTMVKLRLEVIDSAGHYAIDEKDVFCPAPDGFPGCPDRETADANAVDAADGADAAAFPTGG